MQSNLRSSRNEIKHNISAFSASHVISARNARCKNEYENMIVYNVTYETASKIYFFRSRSICGVEETKSNERFKVHRLRDKEEVRLIDTSAPLGKTYDANDEKEIAAKRGQFQLTKIRFYFNGKRKPYEYFTDFQTDEERREYPIERWRFCCDA